MHLYVNISRYGENWKHIIRFLNNVLLYMSGNNDVSWYLMHLKLSKYSSALKRMH